MPVAGVDVGSVAAKAVVLDEEKKIVLGRAVLPTGWNSREAGEQVLQAAGSTPAALRRVVGVVLDIGGQDSKVIAVEDGAVQDFVMNDKCAAGTGRFLQVLSGILGMELPELGQAAATGKPVSISSMCAVFAETEIIGLLAQGTTPADIAAGVYLSIARRMRGLAARIPLKGECTFTGGLATSPAFSGLLAAELGVPVNVPDDPQTVGALGAALVAAR